MFIGEFYIFLKTNSMSVLPNLITDLALILGVAAVVTLLFKWIKFPLVLGYLIAGMLISPHFRLFPSIYDISDVQVWGEIGVIFLLFGLGLEFSFKKLAKMGGPASITAGFEAVGMAIIGYTVGKFWAGRRWIVFSGSLPYYIFFDRNY